MLLCKAVGVFAIWQEKQLDIHSFGQQHIDATFACVNTGIVTVEDNCNVARNAMNEANLVGCESSSGGRNHILYALLVHCHHVGITFHKVAEICFANGLSCLKKAEKTNALSHTFSVSVDREIYSRLAKERDASNE